MKIDVQEELRKLSVEFKDYKFRGYQYIFQAAYEKAKADSGSLKNSFTLKEFYQLLIDRAINSYGPFASTVFYYWGICSNSDLRRIMQRLVDRNLLRLGRGENLEEIDSQKDLMTQLEEPFLP